MAAGKMDSTTVAAVTAKDLQDEILHRKPTSSTKTIRQLQKYARTHRSKPLSVQKACGACAHSRSVSISNNFLARVASSTASSSSDSDSD